jgi:hypothetical protein
MRREILIVTIVLTMMAVPAFSASSFLGGYSGNIITPDAVVEPMGTWEVSYHTLQNIVGDDNINAVGVTYGLMENLEVGASFVNNDESDVALNAKLRLVAETADKPAVLVGVFDAGSMVDVLNDDPSFYLVVSQNVTSAASRIADERSKPVRLSAGIGSGVLDSFFAGLDWTADPRLSMMLEYTSGDFGNEDSGFNAGVRYAVSNNLRLDAAFLDLDDFAMGANLRTKF